MIILIIHSIINFIEYSGVIFKVQHMDLDTLNLQHKCNSCSNTTFNILFLKNANFTITKINLS